MSKDKEKNSRAEVDSAVVDLSSSTEPSLQDKLDGTATPASGELQAQVDLLNEQLGKSVLHELRFRQALQEIIALDTFHTEGEAVKAIARKALEPILPPVR